MREGHTIIQPRRFFGSQLVSGCAVVFFFFGGGGGICIRCINGRFEQDLNLHAPRTWEVGIQATIKMVCAEAQ